MHATITETEAGPQTSTDAARSLCVAGCVPLSSRAGFEGGIQSVARHRSSRDLAFGTNFLPEVLPYEGVLFMCGKAYLDASQWRGAT